MAKYLFNYHGGATPQTEEEGAKVMAAWEAWMGGNAASFLDMGNPVGASVTVNNDRSVTDGGGANPSSGYGIVQADSMDAAVALAKGCPIFDGGGSVEVAELHEM